jgi:hypothetical protein
VTLTGTHFCCVCFGLAGTDITVSFEGLFWIFSAISLIGRQGARGVVFCNNYCTVFQDYPALFDEHEKRNDQKAQ